MGGRSMSQTIDIGRIAVNPSGNYDATNTYNKLDLVYHNGSTWMAKRDNITGIEPGDDSTFGAMIASTLAWQKTAAGSELGSTLPDEGDMLVNDGANLSALPIGTAGQLLTVNASGTQPEWQDKTGGLKVKFHRNAWNASQSVGTTATSITGSYMNIVPESPTSKFVISTSLQAYHNGTYGMDTWVIVREDSGAWTYLQNQPSNFYADYGYNYGRHNTHGSYECVNAQNSFEIYLQGGTHATTSTTNYGNIYWSYVEVMEFWEE
jgi:hypothetical protein